MAVTQEEAEEFAARILAAIPVSCSATYACDCAEHHAADRERVEADLAAIKRWWLDIQGAKYGPSNFYLNHAEGGLYRTAKLYEVKP